MKAPRKALPVIDPRRCTGCGWCVAACAPHVLSLQVQGADRFGPKRSTLDDAAGCTGCALCAVRCALSLWGDPHGAQRPVTARKSVFAIFA